MAEYTAIVEAGNALVELFRRSMTPEPVAKPELITLSSPHESDSGVLAVYLFHIEEDQHSTQQGYFQLAQNRQKQYPTALTLSFLVTALSKAPQQLREADQYRIMGRVVQVLHDNPVLDKAFLSGSLADTSSELHLSCERPNFDQMIKIWNNTQQPYKLSLVVRMSGVSIDSKLEKEISRVSDVEINIERRPDVKNPSYRSK